MLVIHGVTELLLNYHEDTSSECPKCKHNEVTYRVVQKYYHVYGLPFLPTAKYTGIYCNHCDYQTNPIINDKSIIYEKISPTPLYLYTGSAMLILLIAIFIFMLLT